MSNATADSLYELDPDAWEPLRAQLDERQRRLVLSAVAFHSLVNPGRTLTYTIHMGEDYQYPRLTDEGAFTGVITDRAPLIGSFSARSRVEAVSDFPEQVFGSRGRLLRDSNQRHLLLTPVGATDETVRRHWSSSWQERLYDFLEEYHPIVLDEVRNFFWRRFERERDRAKDRRDYLKELEVIRRRFPQPIEIPMPVGMTRRDAPPAVIIAMHWLQAGGAERWALETIRIVREAGMLPIVLTDRDSHQPWITREELDGALVLCLSHPIPSLPADEPLLRALLEQFDVRGVLVHHCQWLYDRLPWLRRARPDLEVIDSLHVLEFGGGFPRAAAVVSGSISLHHVISSQLKSWLVTRRSISPGKIVLAPLVNLTTGGLALSASPTRTDGPPLTLAFVGRLAKQKRPDSFLVLVREAVKAGIPVRAVMHGDGEMQGVVGRIISRYGLNDVVELRTPQTPVEVTLAEANLLVVTSSNEGITLTTFEALAAGIPVLSTDVGAQAEIVPPDALLPRPVRPMVEAAVTALRRLVEPDAREDLLLRERAALARLETNESADIWMKDVVARWAR